MCKLDLDELERLAKAATPGPWYVEMHEAWDMFSVCHNGKDVVKAVSYNQDDASYIVAACNAVPELIAENRALREKILVLVKKNAFLSGEVAGYEIHSLDIKTKLEKREKQLLLLVDTYADIVSCKYCPLSETCSADDKIDADPVLCGHMITEWLEEAAKGTNNDSV